MTDVETGFDRNRGTTVRATDGRGPFSLTALAGLVLLGLSGCGYRFIAGKGALPPGVHSVYAPMLINMTPQPGAEATFTEALRLELGRFGVAAGQEADGRILGELRSIAGRTLGPGMDTYVLQATVTLRLMRAGTVVIQTNLTAFEEYPAGAGGDVLESEANRQAALHRLAGTMMRDACERLLLPVG